jgi:hypothetical protein
MKAEPRFLLEALSRWDFGWRLSQTSGQIILPQPLDFHSTVEAIHHLKRLSDPLACTLVVKVTPDRTNNSAKDTVIEIRHPDSHRTSAH